MFFSCLAYLFGAFLLVLLVLAPIRNGIPPELAWHPIIEQRAYLISGVMLQYATDHQGKYPTGKSSTEVFQKLIDGSYASDNTIFYFPMKGKILPEDGQPLKPENVCFDVTSPVDSSASDDLPLVFSTGYKIDYAPGASAIALNPPVRHWTDHWFEIFRPVPRVYSNDAIIISYKNNNVTFRSLFYTIHDGVSTDNPDNTIPNFMPANFDAQGKTYRQLTPDGEMSDH